MACVRNRDAPASVPLSSAQDGGAGGGVKVREPFASVKLPDEVNKYLQTHLRRINAAYAMLEAAWRGKTGAAPTSKTNSP